MMPFVVIVLKTGTNLNNISERFGPFAQAVQRLQGVVRVAASSVKEAIVVVTETDNLEAVVKMAKGYELRADTIFNLPMLETQD